MSSSVSRIDKILILFVASFGYFVDVYDLWVFAAVRVPSLKALGIPADQLMSNGILLLNMQMIGMLSGGVVFGVLGDRMGRTRVMFLSILTYSLATLANAWVPDMAIYSILRFVSGFGLAGELGLGATLISEILSKEKRSYGVGVLIGLGVIGTTAAGLAAQFFDWKTCYLIGGFMGVGLLLMRMRVAESPLFRKMEETAIKRGDLTLLFKKPERFMRFISCVALGVPTWLFVGVFIMFSEEVLKSAGLPVLSTPTLIVYCNAALPFGIAIAVGLSQLLKSRRIAMIALVLLMLVSMIALLFLPRPLSVWEVKALYIVMSIAEGSWALMAIVAAEAFGTNLRATAATAVPNFARGSIILITLMLDVLKTHLPATGALFIMVLICMGLALLATWKLKETFGKPLDYLEK